MCSPDFAGLAFLLPQQKARPASPANIESAKAQKSQLESNKQTHEQLLNKIKELAKDNKPLIKIHGKAKGEKLFAGIHEEEMAEALKNQLSLQLDSKKHIKIKHPIKTIGIHEITITIEAKKVPILIEVIPAE